MSEYTNITCVYLAVLQELTKHCQIVKANAYRELPS